MPAQKKVVELFTNPIDQLGEIRAKMAELKKAEQALGRYYTSHTQNQARRAK